MYRLAQILYEYNIERAFSNKLFVNAMVDWHLKYNLMPKSMYRLLDALGVHLYLRKGLKDTYFSFDLKLTYGKCAYRVPYSKSPRNILLLIYMRMGYGFL